MKAENYKRLVRLYVPDIVLISGENHLLSDDQAHYLKHVMRKTAGDSLRVFNGREGEWLAIIKEINKKNVIIKLDKQLNEQKSGADIWILAAPVKKEAFDLMVEKACELGASRFIPVVTDHTVIHKINQERLQAVAVEAAEQSERLDVMTVEPLTDLKKCLQSFPSGRNLIFCVERSDGMKLSQAAVKKPLAILIGPEGGFSDAEVDYVRQLKYVNLVSLGTQVLKSETAMIAALSTILILE